MVKAWQSSLLSAICSLLGLLAVLVVGMRWWEIVRGLPGIVGGAVLSGTMALMIRKQLNCVTSVVAAGVGGFVSCFLAIAVGETLPPGSLDWAIKGGAYGAAIGGPLAVVLGPLGLLESRLRTH